MSDEILLCYGVNCTWFGLISEVGKLNTPSGHALPCCPYCKSVLFQMDNEAKWWAGVDTYERGDYPAPSAHPHPGYRAMWEWQREQKRCYSNMAALAAAYAQATGIVVDVTR